LNFELSCRLSRLDFEHLAATIRAAYGTYAMGHAGVVALRAFYKLHGLEVLLAAAVSAPLA
jgi:hypothetical protein